MARKKQEKTQKIDNTPFVENIKTIGYSEEMETSYRDYSLSVIVSRAIPDVRDGLKPVQRRNLYSMDELGLKHDKPYKKSARIVGDTMGKYHPHGDSSIYDAMVHMAHDWNYIIPLVDGHGNFGSIEGDGPAAMRYCVTGDTLINTNLGLIKIEDIVKNSKLNSDNNIDIKVKSIDGKINSASKFFNSGEHDTYKVTLKNNMTITGTNNHPLLVIDKSFNLKWKTISELNIGDKCVIDLNSNSLFGNNNDLDEARMLGCMISEGYITSQNRIGINNKNKQMIEPVEIFLKKQCDTQAQIIKNKKRDYFEYCIADKDYFLEFISKYEYASSAKNKKIPNCVFNGTKEYQREFLRYLFEGDGNVTYNDSPYYEKDKAEITYSSFSKILINQLQIILQTQFGILCSISYSKKRKEYRLCINGINIHTFSNKIGFISDKKNVILNRIPKKTIAKNSYNTTFEMANYIKSKDNKIKRNISNINDLNKFKSYLSKDVFEYCYNMLSNYAFIEIKSIEDVGKQIVYSIKVDSDCHSFIGNGFINHNTEARLSQYSEDCILQDLNKDIVEFVPNFDETETEPSVCPVKVPNILISGTEGIAVGMATKIPTHNLGEVIDGTIAYIENEKITTEELMKYIKGPDFATGGIISNKKDLLEMYETGQGKVRIRAKVETETLSNGKTNIVITEIPYTMIGAIDKFMETVADLVRNKKAPDITDISNQSGKEGIRIIIELRKNADIQKNINILYKKARLEDTFGVIMLAVKDKEPIVFSLKGILKEYLEFSMENYRKKYQMLLEKELKNKEIKEGLVKAYDLIDLIIEILRGSKTTKQAKDCLMFGKTDNITFKTQKAKKEASNLSFTELQATAILEMRLQKLIGLEIDLLNKELKEAIKNIKLYESILNSKTKMKNTIKNDLLSIKEKYAIPRRTQIKDEDAIVLAKEELVEQDYVMLMDRFGYIKLIDIPTFDRNKESIPNDYKQFVNIKNTDKLLIFTDTGKMHSIKALDIPLTKYKEKGIPIDNLSNYDSSKESIVYINAGNIIKDKFLLFVNNMGMAKQVQGENFIVSKKTIDATKLNENEKLLFVKELDTANEDEIIMISKSGNYIRFKIEEIPEKGKTAVGVRCIKLKDDDIVTYASVGNNKSNFTYQNNEVAFQRIKLSKRDGVGTKIRI